MSLLRAVLDDATDAASRDLARFDAERAEMMAVFGNVYLTIGALTETESTLRQALDAALETSDPELIDESEFQYGAALSHLGDLDRAAELLEVERPLDLAGRDPLVARRLTFLAEVSLNRGDPDAIDRALEATRYAETIDSISAAKARFVYAAALRRSGQFDNAEAEFQLAADAFTEADDPIGTSTAVNSLAAIARVATSSVPRPCIAKLWASAGGSTGVPIRRRLSSCRTSGARSSYERTSRGHSQHSMRRSRCSA